MDFGDQPGVILGLVEDVGYVHLFRRSQAVEYEVAVDEGNVVPSRTELRVSRKGKLDDAVFQHVDTLLVGTEELLGGLLPENGQVIVDKLELAFGTLGYDNATHGSWREGRR